MATFEDLVASCDSLGFKIDAVLAERAVLLATLKELWLDACEAADWSDDYRERIDGVIAKAEGK